MANALTGGKWNKIMNDRKEYEMKDADFDKIIQACRPVPYMIIGGVAPRSQQENANDAWGELGSRMGFDSMSVKPSSKGNKFFSAVPNNQGA